MGFLKDTSTLTKMGKEFRIHHNSAAHMAEGSLVPKLGVMPQPVTIDWFRLGPS